MNSTGEKRAYFMGKALEFTKENHVKQNVPMLDLTIAMITHLSVDNLKIAKLETGVVETKLFCQ